MDQPDEINLLPDELRKEEEKAMAKKTPLSEKVSYHMPKIEEKPKNESAAKPSIEDPFSFEDEKKPEPPKPQAPKPELPKTKTEARILSEKPEKNFLSKLFKFKKKEPKNPEPLMSAAEIKPIYKNLQSNKASGLDVNLIPEGVYLMSNKSIIVSLITGVNIALALVLIAFGGLIYYSYNVAKEEEKIDQQIEAKEKEFSEFLNIEAQALDWKNKSKIFDFLIQKHPYWTNFFTTLESVIIPEVYLTNINASTEGNINISAAATDHLAVARQYVALQKAKDKFLSVEVGNLAGTSDAEEVTFSIILKVNPLIFFNFLTNN